MEYKRIAENGNMVRIRTQNGKEFTGILSPNYFIISDHGRISAEVCLTEPMTDNDSTYGCVLLAMDDIKNIELC